MKSYLSGNPSLKLALNEDLVVGKSTGGARPLLACFCSHALLARAGGGYGSVEVDDCNFHECVKLEDWESQRLLSLVPPDGEFVVMNYRITNEFRTPFRVFPLFELVSPTKVELIIKVHPAGRGQGGGRMLNCFAPRADSGGHP
jgi:AP-4 complex subunit mu-1